MVNPPQKINMPMPISTKPAEPPTPRPRAQPAGKQEFALPPAKNFLRELATKTRPQDSNKLLTALVSWLLRCRDAIRSAPGMIFGFFIRLWQGTAEVEEATTLIPNAIPKPAATPTKGILKKEGASKPSKRVSFNEYVEQRSKAGLVKNPVTGQIKKQDCMIQTIRNLSARSKKSTRGYHGQLAPKMRLFLFLENNGLVTSDTALPKDDIGRGLNWKGLTRIALQLKRQEQGLFKQNRDVSDQQSASEVAALARPKGHQQFLYWKPEKISLREWALIGPTWDRFGRMQFGQEKSLGETRAAQLKENYPNLFKHWNPDKESFRTWYGKVGA